MLVCEIARRNGSCISPCQSHGMDLEWFVNGSLIASCDRPTANDPLAVTFDKLSGDLTIRDLRLSSNGTQFTCVCTHGDGTEASRAIVLVHEVKYCVNR